MDCDRCETAMVVDNVTGDPVCLSCARKRAGERLWRDGLAQARAALRRAS